MYRSWKKRWFVIDATKKTIAYWDTDADALKSPTKPLKPALCVEGGNVSKPTASAMDAGYWMVRL
ncbi:hypothetical protein EON66_04360, partial [archaeon]